MMVLIGWTCAGRTTAVAGAQDTGCHCRAAQAWIQEDYAGLSQVFHLATHAAQIPIAFTSDHIETLYELDQEYGTNLSKEVRWIGSVHCQST